MLSLQVRVATKGAPTQGVPGLQQQEMAGEEAMSPNENLRYRAMKAHADIEAEAAAHEQSVQSQRKNEMLAQARAFVRWLGYEPVVEQEDLLWAVAVDKVWFARTGPMPETGVMIENARAMVEGTPPFDGRWTREQWDLLVDAPWWGHYWEVRYEGRITQVWPVEDPLTAMARGAKRKLVDGRFEPSARELVLARIGALVERTDQLRLLAHGTKRKEEEACAS